MLSAALLAALTPLVAGCGTQGTADDKLGRFLVSPEKYEFYNCEQLAEQAKAKAAREGELEALIAKAGAGAGGELVSTLAYRPEYLQVHGEMNELRNAAAEKKCDFAVGAAKDANPALTAPPKR